MTQSSTATLAALRGLTTVVRGSPHTEGRRSINGVDLNTIMQVLVAAVAEIDTPTRWCKNSPGVLRNGMRVQDVDDLTGLYPQQSIGRMCAEGAIHYAAFWQGHPTKVALAAVQLLERYVRSDLYEFNDQPERLHAEVVALFRNAIADLARELAA